jgi:asparagine synthase (glutamine-hydrolysing)
MRSLVVIVDREDPRSHTELAGHLARLGPAPHDTRSPLLDRPRVVTVPGATLASGGAAGLWADEARGLVVGLDGRLDHTSELAATLGLPPDTTPEELVAALWADARDRPAAGDPAARLEGDFAVVVWDVRERTLFAARDAFGVRPLYHRTVGSTWIVASHVDALIAPELGGPPPLDPDLVLDHLTGRSRHATRSHFEGIERVPPGHTLFGWARGRALTRHFRLPETLPAPCRPEEAEEELRRLFFRSVEARFVSDAPVVAHLSGGIDSTAIAFAAASLRSQGRLHAPDVALASAVFPGRSNDERVFIDASTSELPFAAHRWDGRPVDWDGLETPDAVSPWRSFTPAGDVAVARRLGAKVIVSGFGGDELTFEGGVFRDLAAAHRFVALARVVHGPGRYSTRGASTLWREALGAAVPSPLRAWARAVRRQAPAPPPPWLGPSLRDRWPPVEPDDPGPFTSETQRVTWTWLTRPATGWDAEVGEREAEGAGLSLRLPWLDVRLARFVLSLPWTARIPRRGMKSLPREALPMARRVATRARATSHEDGTLATLAREIGRARPLLVDGPWRAAPYVSRREVRARLEEAEAGAAGWREASWLWSVATLERWLRAIDNPGVLAKPRGS